MISIAKTWLLFDPDNVAALPQEADASEARAAEDTAVAAITAFVGTSGIDRAALLSLTAAQLPQVSENGVFCKFVFPDPVACVFCKCGSVSANTPEPRRVLPRLL